MPSKKFKIVHRIPNSNILIDYWKSASQDKYYRFMTYLRIGADDSIKDICESTYTIYTSLFNKWYLITYYQVSEHRIVELRENETLTILDDQSNPAFSVTAFDANYYTGSLMFLFQGSFGNVLYTGFFRPSSFDSIFEAPVLKSLVEKKELDVAYVDNTYAAEHCEFPSRSEIMDQIITCLRQHPKHKIAISGKRLGKEEILLDIAKVLDEKIHVSEDKFIILSRLNLQNHFTTDKKKSRIYACDHIINPKECVKLQAQEGPYIIILLTAFYHCNRMSNNEEFDVPGLYIFPYSGHCSHSELVRFISFLKPRDVQPIIKFMSDEHSVIPQCIYKLCLKPSTSIESEPQTSSSPSSSSCSCKPESTPKFYSCEAGSSQKFYTCESQSGRDSSSSSSATMITVIDPAEKQVLIDNAINELKSFNEVDDFLENANDINNVSNFGQDVSESVMSMSVIELPGGLHESMLDNLLSTSGDSSDMVFYSGATTVNDSSQRSVTQSTSSSSPVLTADNQSNRISLTIMPEMRTKIAMPKTSPVPNTKAFYYKSFDNSISTSSTGAKNDEVETSNRVSDSSQDEVHSTNTYVESDIAENVISSTNNDSLPEIITTPAREPIDRNQRTSVSVTVGDVNIDIRSDLDLQDMSDKDEAPEDSRIRDEIRVEKQSPKEPEIIKTYEDKSVQTDMTLDTWAQLEKSKELVTSRNQAQFLLIQNEAAPLIIQSEALPLITRNEEMPLVNEGVNRLLLKYMSKNKRAAFDTNQSNGKRDRETYQECQPEDENAKRRKVKNALYNSAKTLQAHSRISNDTAPYSHLIGYNLAHPMYRNFFSS